MSDITNARRAEEALAEHRNPDPIDRAKVHAVLSVSRAVREVDTTTRQVNRLIGDSVDELAADLVKVLAPGPRWFVIEPMDSPDKLLIPVASIKSVAEDSPKTVRVELTSGETYLVAAEFDAVAGDITGQAEFTTFSSWSLTDTRPVNVPIHSDVQQVTAHIHGTPPAPSSASVPARVRS